MHILFAGGGTAGHINPALAVADYLKENISDIKISYIGTERGMESRLVPNAGYDFYTIDVAGFQRKLSPQNIKKNLIAVKKVFSSSREAKRLLKDLKPDIVVGTGGYVSGPVLREAVKQGIKTAIHEQNAFPGVTTKMLASKVDAVMLAMPQAEQYLKIKGSAIVTGNPIRQSLLTANRDLARAELGLSEIPMVLSFGGSLGARAINEAVTGLIEKNKGSKSFYIYHATGKSGFDKMKAQLSSLNFDFDNKYIKITEYIDNMSVMLAAADLVVCRAGAITVSELQNCGKASVLIPSPYVAENHQFHNAMTLKDAGAAEIIEEKDLTASKLCEVVEKLVSNCDTLRKMGENARKSAIKDSNKKIADTILNLSRR